MYYLEELVEILDFEKAFVAKYNIKCLAFDGTDDNALDMCKDEKQIEFFKKNISYGNDNNTTNLKEYITTHKNIFLKLDIEGSEFPFLASLTFEEMLNIKQMVLEFHYPNDIQKVVNSADD